MIGIRPRNTWLALGAIALAGFVLRVFPFFGPDGAFSYRVDYDEGVYFSGASLLLQGVLPYRDFVFVHPPGILLFLSLTSAWTRSFLGVDGAFAMSRWIAATMGAASVLLVGRLVWCWFTQPDKGLARWGALFAAAVYATYPELVHVERGPFLEPLLNLVCLALAMAVVKAAVSPHRTRWLGAVGVLAGLAVSIKVWAALWVFGVLWGLSTFATRRELLRFFAAAGLTFGAVVLPLALAAPGPFITEVVLFHAWRPPDAMMERLPRLEQIVAYRHLASPLLALLTVGLLVSRRGPTWTVAARVVVPAYVLTLAAFLTSPAYWSQYNAHLVPSEAVAAGAIVGWALPRLAIRFGSFGALAIGALLLLSLCTSVAHGLRQAHNDTQHLLLARSALKNATDCVFAFEPGWLLAAGRLPPSIAGAPPVVDSYAHQLLGALSSGQRFPTAAAAFASSQQPLGQLEACRNVVLGDRGHHQLSPELLVKLGLTHAPIDLGGLEVWRRIPSPDRVGGQLFGD
jgi:hypothetical protein